MHPARQPLQKPRLRGRQIDTRNANLGESQILGPHLQLGNQRITVHCGCGRGMRKAGVLSAVDRHVPIVKSLRWPDELAAQACAAQLAAQFTTSAALSNAFIALQGDLGAGKTTWVRFLLQALGVQGRIKSPTYAVVESYTLPALDVWHFDFYRFNDPQEWEDAGFRDIFCNPGLKLAEWPDKALGLLPVADVEIAIHTEPDAARRVTLTAHTAMGCAIVAGVTGTEGLA